jgi:putative drug exporter of the RND superfamily
MRSLALMSARAPRRTLAAAILLGGVALVIGAGTPSRLSDRALEFYGQKTESYDAAQTLERAAGQDAFPDLEVIFPLTGPRGPDVLGRVQEVASALPKVFYSRSLQSAVMLASFPRAVLSGPAAARLVQQFRSTPAVTVGGSALIHEQFGQQLAADLSKAELVVFPTLLLLALIVFGGLLPALLPLGTAGVALGATLTSLRLLNSAVPISILSVDVVGGLALGLSLDYSLLLVSRYREEVSRGFGGGTPLLRTVATAGRTVGLSSCTVATAFAAPLVIPIGVLRSLAIGGSLAALCSGLASLAILPAALALLGSRVAGASPSRPGGDSDADRSRPPRTRDRWSRFAGWVVMHPAPIAILAGVALLLISAPALGMRLTGLDAVSLLSPGASARKFDERVKAEFTAPLLDEMIVAVHGSPTRIERIETRFLDRLPDVAASEAYRVKGNLWALSIREAHDPFSSASQRLVRELRRSRFGLAVTGSTADYMDTTASLRSHLPAALLLLALTTVTFLAIATRSLVVPVKTMLMNLLSFTASLGLLVFVFQDGRYEGFLDYRGLGALIVTQPVLLAAGIFGISTDYGIFMLTRIREEWDSGRSSKDAIATGLARTGRIITSVALLFCVSVGSLLTAKTVFVKEAALGLAVAVALDATIVRSLLAPSLMTLLGEWNWWMPRALGGRRRLGA